MINIIFLVGVGVGVVIVFLWAAGREKKEMTINKKQAEKKREYLEQVMEMARTKGTVSNDDVEKSLGVSDATATNYLQELENQGRLEQVGREGRFVRYRPKANG